MAYNWNQKCHFKVRMSPNIYTYVCAFMYFIKFMAKQKIHYDRLNKKENNGIGISKHENLRTIVTFSFD